MNPEDRYPRRFGRYVLLWPLAEGGMGSVSLAMTGTPETLCVIKRVLAARRSDPAAIQRFVDEGNVVRGLSHGNLARTFEVGEIDGEPYLAQELIEGHDLADLRERMAADGQPMPVDVAVYIAREVARGLGYAHGFEDLRLVHRDINPANIRITYSGEVRLLDFGIALSTLKTVETDTGQGVLGRLSYLSPEQIAARAVDHRSDIYSLGVVLWELLAGRGIGAAGTTGESAVCSDLPWLDRVRREVWPSVSAFNSSVTPALAAIVAKAVAKDPGDRFQNARDLQAALDDVLQKTARAEQALAALMANYFNASRDRGSRRDLVRQARRLLAEPVETEREVGEPVIADDDVVPRTRARFLLAAALGGLGAVALIAAGVALARRAGHRNDRSGAAAPVSRPEVVTRSAPTPPAEIVAASPPPHVMVPAASATPASASNAADRAAGPEPDVAVARHPQPHQRPASPPTPRLPGPADANAALARAADAFERNDYSRAIAAAKEALAANGGAPAHVILGNVYLRQRRLAEAEREYRDALRLAPSDEIAAGRLDAVRKLMGGSDRSPTEGPR